MFAVLLTLAINADPAPTAAPKASAGCVGTVRARSQGCTSNVQYVAVAQAGSCHGQASRAFRTPVRSSLRWLTHPRGKTTYYPATAVYVPTATATQSSAPPLAGPVYVAQPAYRTPLRSFACPNGRCPRQ